MKNNIIALDVDGVLNSELFIVNRECKHRDGDTKLDHCKGGN